MKVQNVQIPPIGSDYYAPQRAAAEAKATETTVKEQPQQQAKVVEEDSKLKPIEVLPDSENMLEFVKSFNRFLRTIDNGYSVHYHKAAAREYVIVRDLATNRVLSQYPSDEMLSLMSRVRSVLRDVFVEAHPGQVDKRV